jgi:hypothetical protein
MSNPLGTHSIMALAAALAIPVTALTGCGSSPSTLASRCAEVAGLYRDLQGGVEVVGSPVESSEGNVTIEYEGSDAMNVPVKGSATCEFVVGDPDTLTLLTATVDRTLLGPEDIERIRKVRGSGT